MAKKDSVQYVCSNCGAASLTWSGRCYSCGEWNTLDEKLTLTSGTISRTGSALKTQSVTTSLAKDQKRLVSGTEEIDIVFGGGIVAGSVNLIAGQPGIGKRTLMLQLANTLSAQYKGLYTTGA